MSALSEESIIKHHLRIAAREYDEQVVIVVIDQNKVHSLNGMGSRFWQLSNGRRIGDVVDQMLSEYEVERSQLAADVLRFAGDLVEVGALDVQSTEGEN